jgi:hypothetical protein
MSSVQGCVEAIVTAGGTPLLLLLLLPSKINAG